jgi:hypothetical protein
MGDPGEWALLVGIIVGWFALALMLLAFVAGGADARRRQGLRAARLLREALRAAPSLTEEYRTPLDQARAERPQTTSVKTAKR